MKTILIYHPKWTRSYQVSDSGYDSICQALSHYERIEGRHADVEMFFDHLPAEVKLHVKFNPREPREDKIDTNHNGFLWIDEARGPEPEKQ